MTLFAKSSVFLLLSYGSSFHASLPVFPVQGPDSEGEGRSILGQFLQNSAIEKSEKELKSPKEMEKKSQRVEKTLEDKRKDCLKEK